MDNLLEGWTDFNLAIAGAGAALAGLIMVAMSVNIATVLKARSIPPRAAASISALVLAVTASCLALIPGQPVWALGVEVLIGAVGVSWIEGHAIRAIITDTDRPGSSRGFKIAAGVAPALAFAVGAILLVVGIPAGLYVVAIGSVLAIIAAVLFSWVALIEILR